jgi:hypothetical protein
MNQFRSQEAPSGATIKFGVDHEFATSVSIQKKLLDSSEDSEALKARIDDRIEELVLNMRKQWDLLKANGVSTPLLVQADDSLPDTIIQATYDHRDKRLSVLVVVGYARRLDAVVDLENEEIGSVKFAPSTTLYTPDTVAKARKGKPVVPPTPPPAPSNAPRLGTLKA